MYLLTKVVWLLARPLNLALLALALGAALAAWGRGRWRRAGQWLVGLVFAAMTLINIVPAGSWALVALETRFPPPAALPDRVDGVIVLGGMFDVAGTDRHGTLALNGAADRLWAGLELARRYPEARIVFSGGNALPLTDLPGEAVLAERAFRAAGLEGARMVYEGASRNTRENAVLTRELVKPKPGETWLLVTSAAHMPRAHGSFAAIGWPVVPYPVDYVTGGVVDPVMGFSMMRQLAWLDRAMREVYGLAYYRWRGWTDALFPAPPAQPPG